MDTDSKPFDLLHAVCNSEETYSTYRSYLRRFFDFVKSQFDVDGDKFLGLPENERTEIIRDYLIFYKKNHNQNSVQPVYSAIIKFCKANRVKIDKEYLMDFVPPKGKTAQGRPWTDEHINKMLEYADTTRAKALIHFLSASGVRVGALDGLKLKALIDVPYGYKAVVVYANDKHQHYTFLHPEAVEALQNYFDEREKRGERLDQDSPVFRAVQSIVVKPISRKSVQQIILRIISKAKIQREREENSPRFEIATDHGFRDRFAKIMKTKANIPSDIAEYFIDHDNWSRRHYLDKGLEIEELFAYYQKAVPYLMISEKKRQEQKLKEMSIENAELRKSKEAIEALKEEVRRIKLKSEVVEAMKQGIAEWSEKNPSRVHLQGIKSIYVKNSMGYYILSFFHGCVETKPRT